MYYNYYKMQTMQVPGQKRAKGSQALPRDEGMTATQTVQKTGVGSKKGPATAAAVFVDLTIEEEEKRRVRTGDKTAVPAVTDR